jgi:hypothetical protein
MTFYGAEELPTFKYTSESFLLLNDAPESSFSSLTSSLNS